MKMKRHYFTLLAAASLLISCKDKAVTGPAVLECQIEGEPSGVVVVTYRQDRFCEYLTPELKDGKFSMTFEDTEGFIDLIVSVGANEFGARVNALDTTRLMVTPLGEDRFEVEYSCKTEKESRFWTAWYETYGYMGQYNIRPDPDPEFTVEQAIDMLEKKDSLIHAEFSRMDKYQAHRCDMGYRFIKAILLEQKSERSGQDMYSMPEYVGLLSDLDPEDPAVTACGMISRWAFYKMSGMEGDETARFMSFLKEYSGKIKSESARMAISEMIESRLIYSVKDLGKDTFEEYVSLLEGFSEGNGAIAERCRRAFEAVDMAGKGKPVPDMKMTAPDGSEVMLSSLEGKVVYIDLWATWCGPCCKEIPHLEKLVERMKNNSDIVIISVSCDDTQDPWLKKIGEDKPVWGQYWMSGEVADEFMGKLGIRAIPRFLIVDSDGNFFDADAPRPSDPSIDEVLISATKG